MYVCGFHERGMPVACGIVRTHYYDITVSASLTNGI